MEVKTFKCDICGETFNSGDEPIFEVSTKVIGHDDSLTTYDHVCPKCTSVIARIIDNPSILKEARSETVDLRLYSGRLECLIKDVHQDIVGWEFSYMYNDSLHPDVEHLYNFYKARIDHIKDRYSKLKKSEFIWRAIAFSLIGSCIGQLIVLLLG